MIITKPTHLPNPSTCRVKPLKLLPHSQWAVLLQVITILFLRSLSRYPVSNHILHVLSIGMAPITTNALKIPRTSVASILLPSHSTGNTPRSSLELSWNSLPTPRHSMSDEPSSPKSPGSPTTPGGRRRKYVIFSTSAPLISFRKSQLPTLLTLILPFYRSQKIHGMDYYEFCELVRAGSL